MEWSEYPRSAPGCSRIPYRRYLPRRKIGHADGRGYLVDLCIAYGVVSRDLSHALSPDLYTAALLVEVGDSRVDLEGSAYPCPVSSSLRDPGIDPDPLGVYSGALRSLR